MHAVGDGEDLLVAQTLPGAVGRYAVQLADCVGRVGEAQREGRHIKRADIPIDAASQFQDAVDGHTTGALAAVAVVERTGHSPDQIRVEAFIAC